MTRFLLGTGGAFGLLNKKQINDLINNAFLLGINSFDCGSNYGYGKAERLLGDALRNYKREDIYISTKAGTEYDSLRSFHKDFSVQSIEKSFKKSLKNFNTNYIDTFYLHGPTLNQIDDNLVNFLKKLKLNNQIIRWGVNSHNEEVLKGLLKLEYKPDIVMLDYNIALPKRRILVSMLADNGIKISAGTVLAQGRLINSLPWIPKNKKELFYLLRALLKKTSREAAFKSSKVRRKLLQNYGEFARSIPIPAISSDPNVSEIVIGTTNINLLISNYGLSFLRFSEDMLDNIFAITGLED